MEYWNKYKYTVINSHRKTAENDFNHIGGFLLFFLVYVILEAFAGLESRRVARGDFDFFARLRVFAFSCFSFTRFKNSEADKLNLVVLLYGILYSVNKCLRSDRRIFKGGLVFFCVCPLLIGRIHTDKISVSFSAKRR